MVSCQKVSVLDKKNTNRPFRKHSGIKRDLPLETKNDQAPGTSRNVIPYLAPVEMHLYIDLYSKKNTMQTPVSYPLDITGLLIEKKYYLVYLFDWEF